MQHRYGLGICTVLNGRSTDTNGMGAWWILDIDMIQYFCIKVFVNTQVVPKLHCIYIAIMLGGHRNAVAIWGIYQSYIFQTSLPYRFPEDYIRVISGWSPRCPLGMPYTDWFSISLTMLNLKHSQGPNALYTAQMEFLLARHGIRMLWSRLFMCGMCEKQLATS